MKITFCKWESKTSCCGPYYRQYFKSPEGKTLGCITRDVERPWSDCNNEITTHYTVTTFDSHEEVVFPVLDAAAYVTETGACMNGEDFADPTKVAALHADFLDKYFGPLTKIGEAAHTARQAGAKAKQYIKKIAAQHINQTNNQ